MDKKEYEEIVTRVINTAIEENTKVVQIDIKEALQIHKETHHKNDAWVQAYIGKEKRKDELWQRGKVTFLVMMIIGVVGSIGTLLWSGIKLSIRQ